MEGNTAVTLFPCQFINQKGWRMSSIDRPCGIDLMTDECGVTLVICPSPCMGVYRKTSCNEGHLIHRYCAIMPRNEGSQDCNSESVPDLRAQQHHYMATNGRSFMGHSQPRWGERVGGVQEVFPRSTYAEKMHPLGLRKRWCNEKSSTMS
jgi:hypothetical protein